MANRLRKGISLAGWIVGARLGERGGNGEVYRATKNGVEGALKVLTRRSASYDGRFRREIDAMRMYRDIPGVLPLLDSSCPPEPSKHDLLWCVMGLAQPIREALGPEPSIRDVVSSCADIAETLAAVHLRGGSHRDIKPENLFKDQGRYAVGDFGLVEFPGQTAITAEGEKVGPLFYIAPEMLNEARRSDGRPADVFSLAKTLWVLATGQTYPLPGQMDRTIPAMTISAYLIKDVRAPLLDRLLEEATANDSGRRPDMTAFAQELRAWLVPTVALPSDDIDLQPFARDIDAINQKHHVRELADKRVRERIADDGHRVQGRFQAVVEAIEKALAAASFINARSVIHNYDFGFLVSGLVMNTAGPGEVELKLEGLILVPGHNEVQAIQVNCQYVAVVTTASSASQHVLWKDSGTFLPDGSGEEVEVQRLVSSIRSHLIPAVERVLELSRGT